MRTKSPSISIRRANLSERADLGDIKLRVSMMWPDYRRLMLDDPESMAVNAADIRDGRVMVLEANGEKAGFATLSPYGDGDRLLGFYLDPGHWGDAIATQRLLHGAAEQARLEGVRRLWVLTTQAAVTFWENQGFTQRGPVETQDGPRIALTFDVLETIGTA